MIGNFPYRMALAGGWIDQPFISSLNPRPPGSMVVVSLEPTVRFMDRCGMATGTRKVAIELWNGELPKGDPAQHARELYAAENRGRTDPSGSQDMIGLIYPGVSRLDYKGGRFPVSVVSDRTPQTASWFERVMHVIAVNQRPAGYYPLGIRNLDPEWIARLGQTGKDCFDAIESRNLIALGTSMNECMRCWEAILPDTVAHPSIDIDLTTLLSYYQERYPGAMYSGCGGGYLFVASDQPVPGAFHVQVRTA